MKKGKRNRPGLEDQAVRRTTASMNVKNSVLTVDIQPSEEILAMERAQGVCYRCGSKDHFLKSCPKPFTTVLAFAPEKKGGPKERAKQRMSNWQRMFKRGNRRRKHRRRVVIVGKTLRKF